MGGVLRAGPAAQQQRGAQHHEGHDDDDLDHGEPVFERTVAPDAEPIDREQQQRGQEHPGDARNGWKPERHVGRRGDHLGADRNRDGRPVAGAGQEPCPLAQIQIAIELKRSCGRMQRLASSPSASVTVQVMKAASRKVKMTAGPAASIAAAEPSSSPVPIDPPTATIAICPAVSWRWRPSSCRVVSWLIRGAARSSAGCASRAGPAGNRPSVR